MNEKVGLSTKDVNFIKIGIFTFYIIHGNWLLMTTYEFVIIDKLVKIELQSLQILNFCS